MSVEMSEPLVLRSIGKAHAGFIVMEQDMLTLTALLCLTLL